MRALICLLVCSCATVPGPPPVSLQSGAEACKSMAMACRDGQPVDACDAAEACINLYELGSQCVSDRYECQELSKTDKRELQGAKNDRDKAKSQRWIWLGVGVGAGLLLGFGAGLAI